MDNKAKTLMQSMLDDEFKNIAKLFVLYENSIKEAYVVLLNAVEYIAETTGYDEDYVMQKILGMTPSLMIALTNYKEGM